MYYSRELGEELINLYSEVCTETKDELKNWNFDIDSLKNFIVQKVDPKKKEHFLYRYEKVIFLGSINYDLNS